MIRRTTKNGWFNCTECERYPDGTCPKWDKHSRNVPLSPNVCGARHWHVPFRPHHKDDIASFRRMGYRGDYWPERWRPEIRFMR